MQFRVSKKKTGNSHGKKIDKTEEKAESDKKTIQQDKPQEENKAKNYNISGSSDAEVPHPRTFSINQALNGKKNSADNKEKQPKESQDDDSAEENYGSYEFSTEDLIKAWKEFAETVKDRPRLFHLFSSRKPEIKEKEVILIHLDNPLQKDILENILPQLLNGLRARLNNSNISIETKVIHTETNEKDNGKLYTMEDKFNYLVKKNPVLQKLKRNMDLDFDY